MNDVPAVIDPGPGGNPAPAARRSKRIANALEIGREYGILVFVVALFVVLCFASSAFLTEGNLKNLFDQSASVGLIALAGSFVIIAGGFDLSAGAIYAVCSIIGAKVSNSSGAEVGIIVALAAGSAMGLLNAVVCTVGRVNPFVATVASGLLLTGLAEAISGGELILISDESFSHLSSPGFLDLNNSTWIFIIAIAAAAFVLNRTVFGRRMFGTGANPVAARLSGISTYRVLGATYVLSGFAAALAGLIATSRSLSVSSEPGAGIVFDAIAAILIGGNSVLGGEGAVWRTVMGVLVLALIGNGFNLLGIDPLYQKIVSGGIILIAVTADAYARRDRV